MKILIIADPIENLRPATDTSISLAKEFMARGHTVAWSDVSRLSLVGHVPQVRAADITAVALKTPPQLGPWQSQPLTDFGVILIRKDPPFNEDYVRLCWLLSLYEDRLVISNRASLLLQHHEKMIPFQAVAADILSADELIPTCVSQDPSVVEAFCAEQTAEAWIVKPWTGFGGHDVTKLPSVEMVLELVRTSAQPLIVQPFMASIAQAGDRRVFYVGGEMLADFVRIPPAGAFISNLASGGRAEFRPMDPATKDRCLRLGRYLRELGFDFAGADVIDGRISEVNVTSPTGVVSLMDLGGPNLAPHIVNRILERT